MKSKKKKYRQRMRTKIAFYLIGFTIVYLLVIWLCETVFLKDIYRYYKTKNVEKQAVNISSYIISDNLKLALNSLYDKFEFKSVVVNSRGQFVAKSSHLQNGFLSVLSTETARDKFDDVDANDGVLIEFYDIHHIDPNYADTNLLSEKNHNTMVYYKKVIINNDRYLVIIETEIAPIEATVEALKLELTIITIAILIISVIMVHILSVRLAKPIIRTNETAKKFADGEFPKNFKNKSYKEIAELNETLEYASDQLERVDKLSNEIIANVSHDLRTPLTMISGYAEAMRDIPGESSPENLQIIIDESDRLKNLVNQLLFLSKLKSGSNKLEKTDFNITEVVKSIVSRINKMVEQDGFEVVFAHIESVNVYADRDRIEQVIYNLIANAIAYTGDDLKVLVRQTVTGESVKIEVIDSGKGIEPDMIPYVWKRYYKNPYAKSAYKGVGVGLSIVKGILDLQEADYGIQSEVGKGSNFWFKLKRD